MKATSAIPIMSAAAVAAVRPGLRTEFPLASLPAAPPIRRAGRPTSAAMGRTSRDESIAMPDEQEQDASREPEQAVGRAQVVGEHRPAEQEQRSDDDEAAIHGTNGEIRERGSVAPSRTAAIGGTRVARMRREEPRGERHQDADEHRDDDRAQREDAVG